MCSTSAFARTYPGRARWLHMCVFLFGAGVNALPAAEAPKPEPDADELIRRLGSDEFRLREEATRTLTEHADQFWEKLEQAAKSGDLEIRHRARLALAEPTRRGLTELLEKNLQEVATAEKAFVDERNATQKTLYEKQILEVKTTAEAEKMEIELRKLPEGDARKELQARLDAAKQVIETAVKEQLELRKKLEDGQRQYKLQQNRRQSTRDQLKQLLESGDFFSRKKLEQWSPALLPFARRLGLHISFEFVDTPLAAVVAQVGESIGIKIECAEPPPEGQGQVTLRVTDMNADMALDWICRLVDMEYRVVRDEEKIILQKPRADRQE